MTILQLGFWKRESGFSTSQTLHRRATFWLLVSEPGIFGVSGVFLVKPIWNLVFGPREPSHVVDLAEKIIFVFGIPRIDAKTAPKLTRIIPAKSQPTYPPFSGPSQGQSGWLERWKGWSRRDLLRGTGPGSQKPASRHVLWGISGTHQKTQVH